MATVQLTFDPETLERKAEEVASMLRAIANPRRLVILCRLVEQGEATPTMLAADVALSQPALSQHLAKMRAEGLVTYRREGQTLRYRIADRRLERLFAVLHDEFCQPDATASQE
jgi:ArsR family transcriptional regulator